MQTNTPVIFNSLTKKYEEFVPNNRQVSWYMCGPTVYDAPHMGHARTYIVFDTIRRLMIDYLKFDIDLVMNITDIDDKIIQRAQENKTDFKEYSQHWEKIFWLEMERLNVLLPQTVTRVSEYVEEIIDYISTIINNGYAYCCDGSVYFDLSEFKSKRFYGWLEPSAINDTARAMEGEGGLGSTGAKKHPNDFVLWKKSRQGEPKWSSPWGYGRPGWHIECSTMACHKFGNKLDIHTGGIDLRFPHHDNEIAQVEAYYDTEGWVKYFLHSGHLNIYGEKMSKSLKNFVTIDEVLKFVSFRVVRLAVVLNNWEKPMNYSPDGSTLNEAIEIDQGFMNFFSFMRSKKRLLSAHESLKLEEKALLLEKEFREFRAKVHEAVLKNFNTPAVIYLLKQLINDSYRCYGAITYFPYLLALDIARYIFNMLKVLGITKGSEDRLDYVEGGAGEDGVAGVMQCLTDFRQKIRDVGRECMKRGEEPGAQLLAACDQLRDEDLVKIGILMKDDNDQVTWELRNLDEIALEKNRKPCNTKKEQKEPPIDPKFFFSGDAYSAFDEEGVPTKMADGSDVTKSMTKKLRKMLTIQKKKHHDYQQKL